METKTATDLRQSDIDVRQYRAVIRLLNRLRRWVRVYPKCEGDHMPEHGVDFFVGIDDGPGNEIAETIRTMPALWLHAVPPDVVMIPRRILAELGVSHVIASACERQALAIIENEAARQLQVYEKQQLCF